MKRRASIQLVPEKDFIPEYEDPYSTEPEEYTPSKRIIYKAKIGVKPDPKCEPLSTSKSEPPIPQQSSSYLSLLASLKSSTSHEQTEQFLKEINSASLVTPRRILPSEQTSYANCYQIESKLSVNETKKGKGTMELNHAIGKPIALVVFRNCIKNILFTGAIYQGSKLVFRKEPCKSHKHEGKIDAEITLLQQPEGAKCVCLLCVSADSAIVLSEQIAKSLEYIKG